MNLLCQVAFWWESCCVEDLKRDLYKMREMLNIIGDSRMLHDDYWVELSLCASGWLTFGQAIHTANRSLQFELYYISWANIITMPSMCVSCMCNQVNLVYETRNTTLRHTKWQWVWIVWPGSMKTTCIVYTCHQSWHAQSPISTL